MAANIPQLLADLADEHAALDRLLARGVSPERWGRETPAPGWTVAHQVAHLVYFDQALAEAIEDPGAFAVRRERAAADAEFGENVLLPLLTDPPGELLARWRRSSERSRDALAGADPQARIPWFGPSMGVASKISARIMETWAHGQDIADAWGERRAATSRLRHVAELAVRARPYSYLIRQFDLPEEQLGVRLRSPDGETWTYLDPSAESRIEGDALEFCLVLTRRRHVDDTSLRCVGGAAREWLEIGQAFAGDPGPGRKPGQFPQRTDHEGTHGAEASREETEMNR